jgi:hypothetical protein
LGKILQREVDGQASLAGDAHVLVSAFRGAFNTEHGIAALEQSAGDWIEILLRNGIAYFAGPSLGCERQCDPLADEGDVPGVVDAECEAFKTMQVPLDPQRIAIGSRAIWPGYEHKKRFGYVHMTSEKQTYLNHA